MKFLAGLNELAKGDFDNEKVLGRWWNSRDIEIVEVQGKPVALSGFNGESYCDCFYVSDKKGSEYYENDGDLSCSVYPVYRIDEDSTDDDDFEFVGYWAPQLI